MEVVFPVALLNGLHPLALRVHLRGKLQTRFCSKLDSPGIVWSSKFGGNIVENVRRTGGRWWAVTSFSILQVRGLVSWVRYAVVVSSMPSSLPKRLPAMAHERECASGGASVRVPTQTCLSGVFEMVVESHSRVLEFQAKMSSRH